MSKLEELIQKLCPNGVEQESIKNICKKICSGGTPKSSVREYYGGNIPWLRTQEVNFCDIFDTDIKITELGYNKSSAKLIPVNCVIVAMYGATAGKVAINKIELTTNQACCNLEIDDTKALYRYVYHFLCSRYEYIKSLGQGSQNNINANIVKELKIPVPPLEIQREIVRILDKFTELTEELTDTLTEEIINRKKQYKYYRDKLLTVEKSVHSEKLKSISKISRGVRVTKSQLSDEGFPVYQNSLSPMGHYSEFNVLGGTTYIITAGAAGEIGFSNEDFWAADDCIVLTKLKGVTNRYLYHFLMTKKEYIKSRVRKASIPRLSKEVIENLIVPVPSMEVQNKIINTLDNFDTVCSNLNIDVSSEIEARQKQYEYYRDLLLTFAETGNTILTDRQTDSN
jgi:type I restriction enzyme S subunit